MLAYNSFNIVKNKISDEYLIFGYQVEAKVNIFKEKTTEEGVYFSKTTMAGYILNPILVSSLTVFHGMKTIEWIARTVYNFSQGFFAALLALSLLGSVNSVNYFAKKKMIKGVKYLNNTALSFTYTLTNIWLGFTGLQNRLSTKHSIDNELYLVFAQNRLSINCRPRPTFKDLANKLFENA